jgi:polyhydroxyalkanoate synthesis regulator phasin
MALEAADLKIIETKISDALVGAGEPIVAQAKAAVAEALKEFSGKAEIDPAKLEETVNARVQAALEKQAADLAARSADDATKKAAVDAWTKVIAEKAPKLPAAYQALIAGETPEELAASTEKAVTQYQADLKASGAVLPAAGTSSDGKGDTNAAAAAAAAAKLSPTQKIAAGLEAKKQ